MPQVERERIIPREMKVKIDAEKLVPREFTVKVQLPDEARQILKDLHEDRQSLGAGMVVLLACVVALVVARVVRRNQA